MRFNLSRLMRFTCFFCILFIYLFFATRVVHFLLLRLLSLVILTALVFGRGTLNSNTLSWKELAGDATPRKECKMALDLVVLVLFFHVR